MGLMPERLGFHHHDQEKLGVYDLETFHFVLVLVTLCPFGSIIRDVTRTLTINCLRDGKYN